VRAENKKTMLIITMTLGAFVVGIIPWLLLVFEKARTSVKWLGEIYFQRWGWFLVLFFASYALKEIRGWNVVSKSLKTIAVIFLLIMLVWAAIWFLLTVFGYITSTIT